MYAATITLTTDTAADIASSAVAQHVGTVLRAAVAPAAADVAREMPCSPRKQEKRWNRGAQNL